MSNLFSFFIRGDVAFFAIFVVLVLALVSLFFARKYNQKSQNLKMRNEEMNDTAKVLVRRDLELSRSNEKLLELDELKSKFVSIAAHQLRTPLTTITWSLNELLEGDFGKFKKKQEKALRNIISVNNLLIGLVNDLLDVSRLEEGLKIFEMRRQDLIVVIREIRNNFSKIVDSKGIKFILDLKTESLELNFDKEKLIIALSNLVDNAIKYTMPGGSVTIKVAYNKEKKDEVLIEISDTGIGIPKDQMDRVFNRFFRAHNAMILETYGSGLGLFVVKEIIDKHNGSINFTSEEGKGSVFSIILPTA